MIHRVALAAAVFFVGGSVKSNGVEVEGCSGSVPVQQASAVASGQSLDSAIDWVVKGVTPSVVRIWFGDEDMITGTIISSDGLVLTCAHLPVPVGDAVQIGLFDGRRVPAKVLSRLPRQGESNLGQDIALVQITEAGSWPAAPVAAAAPTGLEETVLALGFPDTQLYGLDRAVDPLYVRMGRPIHNPYQSRPEQIVTSMFGVGGDSGGPLFDLSGRVIGVVHGGDPSGSNLNYTRIEILRQNWEKLAPGKTPPREAPDLFAGKETPVLAPAANAAARGVRDAVVEVHSGSRWIGLGCVVGDGLILTKASELGPNLTVVLTGNRVGIVEVAATDPAWDLALLRLQFAPELTNGIEPVRFLQTEELSAGRPLTLATPAFLTPVTGVACFAARPVPRIDGFIPCEMEEAEGGVKVTRVIDEMRTFRLRQPSMPLRKGDIVTAIEGTQIGDLASYRKLMFESERIGNRPCASGEPMRVTYRRGDATADATVVLEFSRSPTGQLVRPVSNRYSAFGRAIATDLAIRPEHCGAPVMDSGGRVVGLLIARAPFIESLVIPAGNVAELLKGMVESASAGR